MLVAGFESIVQIAHTIVQIAHTIDGVPCAPSIDPSYYHTAYLCCTTQAYLAHRTSRNLWRGSACVPLLLEPQTWRSVSAGDCPASINHQSGALCRYINPLCSSAAFLCSAFCHAALHRNGTCHVRHCPLLDLPQHDCSMASFYVVRVLSQLPGFPMP